MPIKTTLLTLLSLVSFAAAYRFGSHGMRLHDGLCIGMAPACVTASARSRCGGRWRADGGSTGEIVGDVAGWRLRVA